MNRTLLRSAVSFTLAVSAVSCTSTGSNSSNSADQYDLLPYQMADRWGYLNQQGKAAINPQFAEADLFHDGLARVENTAHKVGYINPKGTFIIAPAYEAGLAFSEGLACVVPASGQITYVDTKGAVKFTLANAQEARSFHEGLAAVRIGEKWGYVNPEGRLVITPTYSKASSFVQGQARVEQQRGPFESKAGFINKQNQIVIPLEYADVSYFSQNRAVVKVQEKYGYLDDKGTYVINPQFDQAGMFSQGLAPVRLGNNWGFIDESGKIAINPSYAGVLPFSANGLALAGDNATRQIGYLDREGKWAINAQFEEATPFYADIAFAKVGSKWGVIDKQGKFLENPTYDDVYQPKLNGSALVEEDGSVTALTRDVTDSEEMAVTSEAASANSYTPVAGMEDVGAEGEAKADAMEAASDAASSSALPTEEQVREGAPAYLTGTWRGKLDDKPFTLHIDKVAGDQVSGWNQVGSNKRPVSGTFWAWVEGDGCGYGLKLNEPGDDKWDGKFELQVTSKEGGALNINHAYGTWTANNGKSEKSVSLDK
ncbi:WG repeat-containing protein [Hymenobacter taeanensis]|uniref:WG repeat-containing protein n=1 Tax=Hymenobacter taeanensis TaxID=2735321 RepID=A0A6M6BH10_9BACT|nr:WG repeat-containing protein [Hymenobacter taeanensis]QJX47831.1 WG repeat-containing protein [Hymenobacter taeanensis]